jgi:methanogenic corrinoid protein MtbC1
VPGPTERPGYSIAAVSKLTGVSCHALRAWERRYGFPIPRRAESGHRRYDTEQVQAIRLVARHLQQGHPIGAIVAQLLGGRLEPAGPGPAAERLAEPLGELVDRLMGADLFGAEAVYARLACAWPPQARATEILGPALTEIGERWFRGECSVCQEHCASQFLRAKLHVLLEEARRSNPRPRRTAVLGTVQGDRHEGGILIVALLLELAGWRALTLGVDLPVRDFRDALDRWRPDALGLSFVLSRNINKRFEELARIRDVPVFVGGRSILNYQGLARRHGLVPLAGAAAAVLQPFLDEVERQRPLGSPVGPPA